LSDIAFLQAIDLLDVDLAASGDNRRRFDCAPKMAAINAIQSLSAKELGQRAGLTAPRFVQWQVNVATLQNIRPAVVRVGRPMSDEVQAGSVGRNSCFVLWEFFRHS
jgi:hypothetical protein